MTSTAGAPTSYVIHRSADGLDRTWSVPTSAFDTTASAQDPGLPAGVSATYTVVAHNAAGDSAESGSVAATVPSWDGPYTGAHNALTMVWDQNGSDTPNDRVTTQVVPGSATSLSQAGGWQTGFSGGTGSITLPQDLADGDYTLGSGAGELAVDAGSGLRCTSTGGGAPSGTAVVSRSAPAMTGYASLSLDADLHCANGHQLRVELRWATPDDFHALGTAPSTVLEAAPGDTVTRDVPVTNLGTTPITLGAARLHAGNLSTIAPLTVTGSTCEGSTLAPGLGCTVTVQYSAGTAASREGNGFLALDSERGEIELGQVIGQQPAAYSGPQDVHATGQPGTVTVTWAAPTTMDSRLLAGWRIEEMTSSATSVLFRSDMDYTRSAPLRDLTPGEHTLRLVLRTDDGREIAAAPFLVTVPRRWLLVATTAGVRALDPDGGGTDGDLFGSSAGASGVAVSPTRDRVVVARDRGWTQVDSATGMLLGTAFSDPVVGDDGVAVSPDGARLVLHVPATSGATTRDSSLVVVALDTKASTTVPGSAGLSAPSWTPDGTTLVAARDADRADATPSLVTVNPATGARAVVPGTAHARGPALSRTGRLAYIVWNQDHDEVRVGSLGGGASVLVGSFPGITALAWDPTGTWLAATGATYGQPQQTFVYDMSGTPKLTRTLAGGSAVAWLDTRSAVPAATVGVPAWTTPTASVSVGATDADDAVGGLRRECRLDTAVTWAPCGQVWTVSGLAPGSHTAYARVTDPSGQQSLTASRSWAVDASAPTATLGAVPSVLTAAPVTLSWSASDTGGSGLSSFAVRERYAAPTGKFGAFTYPSGWQALSARSLGVRLAPGYEYCFSVRARDVAGNVGAWSAERCTTVALDDRALSATGRWLRGLNSGYAFGTYSTATSAGASLSRSGVQARRLVLVAATCPTCGSVDVYHGGVRIGRVSLYSARTAYRQLRWLPIEAVTRTGTVVLRTVDARPVYLDGVAAIH